ncbi:MAG: TldD/PmbA family protein [Halanaerobiaceae bacterium]
MEMNFTKFKDQLFSCGSSQNFSQMELFQNKSRSFKLRVFNQEIDHYAINEDSGISFRAPIEGKMGYSFTEKMDQESIELLLDEVKQNAAIVDNSEEEIFSGSKDYQEIAPYREGLKQISPDKKIELVKRLEKEALEFDDRISAVNYCLYSDLEFEERLLNTYGLDLKFKNNIAYIYISVVARDNDQVKTGSDFYITQDFSEFSAPEVAHRAAEEALAGFGAQPVKSDSYPVVFRNDVMADFLSAYSSTLSAENVQKGLSLFKGKIGQNVASPKITVVDDPFFQGGFQVRPFDAEGVATKEKCLIEEGELQTFLHNLKTARKDGVSSTGNAYRGSHKSYIDIAPTNMYIQPGEYSREELISSIDQGLLITKLQGMHAGTNSVSGDFSLSAAGFFIKEGEKKQPVEQITVAGNFIDMLQDIQMVGEDLKLSLPGSSHIGAPSIKVKSLDISGS